MALQVQSARSGTELIQQDCAAVLLLKRIGNEMEQEQSRSSVLDSHTPYVCSHPGIEHVHHDGQTIQLEEDRPIPIRLG